MQGVNANTGTEAGNVGQEALPVLRPHLSSGVINVLEVGGRGEGPTLARELLLWLL
jgi:hypothetical protein